MGRKRQVMIELDPPDFHLLFRISEHLRLPMVYVMRIALRHYAQTGDWPIGTNGLREEVWEGARSLNTIPHRRKKP